MRLLNIKIEKLYGEFDYDIPLNNDEHIKILTGPNGYGKTMILNIIYNLITKNFYFFRKLNFVKIEVNLDSDRQIIITKEIADKISDVKFELFLSNIINGRFSFVGLQENIVSRLISVFKTPKGTWYSKQDEKEYDEEELIAHHKVVFDAYYDSNGIEGSTDSIDLYNEWMSEFSIQYIKEQRVYHFDNQDKKHLNIEVKVESLKKGLEFHLNNGKSYSEILERSFPKRLFNEKNTISKLDYESRIKQIRERQNQLNKFGLYSIKEDSFLEQPFSENDSKALLVYIQDLEKKLDYFNDIVNRLNLFVELLNNKLFTNKEIVFSISEGLYFVTTKGERLVLNELSSGEQNQFIILFDLIFDKINFPIVLIDEPELSLHIAWQKAFLDDLKKINQLHNNEIQFIVATHAPAIISGRWDLVYDLYAKGE